MRKKRESIERFIPLGAVAALMFCGPVLAQGVTPGDKYEWFLSALFKAAALGVILGLATAWGWLRRIKYAPEELSIDPKVRRALAYSLVVSLFVFAAALWADIWLIYSFPRVNLGALEALSEALSGWYWVALLGLAAACFFVTNYVHIRLLFKGFSGRYALNPSRKAE
jgi:hypothetical protein